jgi:4-amino-4-deoxy-L-arabinose transferase-like glycosyltransferase
MAMIRKLWLPFSISIAMGIVAIYFRPLFPIDETRYVSVAWEMWQRNDFLVPFLNGEPYHHKPPLYFWLIHLSWSVFGVNDVSARVIPLVFCLSNIVLVYRMSLLLWPKKEDVAQTAAVILSSTLLWAAFNALVMFDVILTFWTLLALTGILRIPFKEKSPATWGWVGAAIGFGILTKGPVILVYVLPIALSAPWWHANGERIRIKKWFAGLLTATAVGAGIALSWAVPAALSGGEAYREAILWGQTANRIVASFAHERAWWWYIPIIPVVLCPWLLCRPAWKAAVDFRSDRGTRFCSIWFVSVIFIFSLISGKQIHYLLPIVPAFALFAARSIGKASSPWTFKDRSGISLFFILTGAALLVLPHFHLGSDIGDISRYVGRLSWAAVVSIALGGFLLVRRGENTAATMKSIAVCMLIFFSLLHWGGAGILARYDLSEVSRHIKTYQDEKRALMHYGKYHGQFAFIGRLESPLPVIRNKTKLRAWAADHPEGIVLSYVKAKIFKKLSPSDIYFSQPYKSKRLVIWPARNFLKILGEK